MPITRRQFELGIDDCIAHYMELAHTLLAEHREQAFTFEEIFASLQPALINLAREHAPAYLPHHQPLLEDWASAMLRRALQKLCELRAADCRRIGDEEYYAYLQELPSLR